MNAINQSNNGMHFVTVYHPNNRDDFVLVIVKLRRCIMSKHCCFIHCTSTKHCPFYDAFALIALEIFILLNIKPKF